jgi:hypothetical protein
MLTFNCPELIESLGVQFQIHYHIYF